MSKYLAAERIKLAVNRLRASRAKITMLDFLLIKRAIKLGGSDRVILSLNDLNWKQACAELMACNIADYNHPGELAPSSEVGLYNPFGTEGHTTNGYRKNKYISNGTGSTVVGGRWTSVFTNHNTRPTALSLRDGYLESLVSLILKATKSIRLPILSDAAVWFHRFQDVSAFSADTNQSLVDNLATHFREQLGLTDVEVAKLFDVDVREDIL